MSKKLPNLAVTWKGLGGEKLVPFDGNVESTDGSKAMWLNQMFINVGAIPECESLNGTFSAKGNTLKAEIVMAYLSLINLRDSSLADKFINGERSVLGLHPEYVKETKCYG